MLLIIATTLGAQPVNLIITSPDTLGGCMPNRYVAETQSQGARFTVSLNLLSGNNTPGCADDALYFILDSIKGNYQNPWYNAATKQWSVTITDAGTVKIYYRIAISCGLIPVNDSISSYKLEQTFTDSTGLSTYTIGQSGNKLTTSILLPLITDVSPKNYMVSYTDTVDVLYYYINKGSANPRIDFSFTDDASHYCNNLAFIDLSYQINTGNFVSYTSGSLDSVLLKSGDTLKFRSRSLVTGCTGSSCATSKATFNWHCSYSDDIPNFCLSCTGSKDSYYYLKPNDSPKLYFTRITPSIFPEQSCMNSAVQWEYIVTNTGVGALDTSTIRLGASSFNTFQYLSLIDTSTLTVSAHCTGCTVKINKYVNPNALCSTGVNNALSNANIQLKKFGKYDTLFISYSTYRCAEENDLLLNEAKYYNRWSFASNGFTICGNAANGTYGNWPLNIGQTDYNGNIASGDINQKLFFVPSVTDLSVAGGQTFGDSATMEIEMNGLMGDAYDYVLLNCPSGAS